MPNMYCDLRGQIKLLEFCLCIYSRTLFLITKFDCIIKKSSKYKKVLETYHENLNVYKLKKDR